MRGSPFGFARSLVLGMAGVSAAGAAFAADPPLKPGRDPGGTAVAVLTEGIDYTRPALAAVLARDGEGEAIAWDATDGDHRPFAADGNGSALTLAAAARGGVRLVAVRYAGGDGASLARAIAFAAGTPARIVVVPLNEHGRSGLGVLKAAAQTFGRILFVGSLPAIVESERTGAEPIANLVLLDSKDSELLAAETTARVLGCGHGDLASEQGSELKRAYLERAAKLGSAGGKEPEAAPDCGERRQQESDNR